MKQLLKYLWSLRLIFILGFIGGFCGMWTYESLTKVLHDKSFEAVIKERNDLSKELEQTKERLNGAKGLISQYEKIFKEYDVYLKEK